MQQVQLESRSLAEQMQMLSGCRLLVGLHGAGLTNMLWMPQGSQAIEVRRCNDSHNNSYFTMANALSHSYSYLKADELYPDQTIHSAELKLEPGLLELGLHEEVLC